MQIAPFDKQYLSAAVALFIQNFRELRRAVPETPDSMEDPAQVRAMLEELLAYSSGVMALEGDRLVGYMGWFIVEKFRRTERKAAYCPEWGHAVEVRVQSEVYRAMYRAAAEQWAESGCQTHALTLLAHDPETKEVWFWNGFGLMVVDAIRTTTPLGVPPPTGFSIRKASAGDTEVLSILDAEHGRHYARTPIFMVTQSPRDTQGFENFISQTGNRVFLAMQGDRPVGYLQFESKAGGAADVVQSEDTVANSGAYIRPEFRGKKVAAAILDAALEEYASMGYERCSVDFESFNPEAARFWMKYFKPVCLSVGRVPEV